MNSIPNRFIFIITFFCLQLLGTQVSAVPVWQPSSAGAITGLNNFISKTNYKPAIDSLKRNNFSKVIELAQTYISTNPADAQAHLLLALGYIGNKDTESLEQHMRELGRQLPLVSDAVAYQISVYFAKQGRFYLALKYINVDSGQFQPIKTLKLKGELYRNQGQIDSALVVYDELLKIVPKDEEALFTLARLNLIANKPSRVIEYAKQLIKSKPHDASVYLLLATAELLTGDIPTAEKSFRNALKYDPKNEIAWFNLGIIRHLNSDYQGAIKSYREALVKSKSLQAQVGLSYAYLSLNDVQKSNAQLQNIRMIRNNNANDNLLEASIQYSLKHNDKANAAYQKAGALFVDFQVPDFEMQKHVNGDNKKISQLFAFTNFLYLQGYHKIAIDLFNRNKKLVQQSAFLQITYARCMEKTGKPNAAGRLYMDIKKQHEKLISPILEKADLDFKSGLKTKALTGYKAALKMYPGLVSVRYRLGSLYNDVNQPDNAVEEYKYILETHSDSAKVLNQIAATLAEKMRRPKEAIEYAKKALKIEPKNSNIKYTLASIQFDMRDYQQASSTYSGLVVQTWNDPLFYYRAGNAFLKVHKEKEAALLIEKSLNLGIEFEQRARAEKQLKKFMSK